jgi:hypothetical protein
MCGLAVVIAHDALAVADRAPGGDRSMTQRERILTLRAYRLALMPGVRLYVLTGISTSFDSRGP